MGYVRAILLFGLMPNIGFLTNVFGKGSSDRPADAYSSARMDDHRACGNLRGAGQTVSAEGLESAQPGKSASNRKLMNSLGALVGDHALEV
jgi:hypothetical protein